MWRCRFMECLQMVSGLGIDNMNVLLMTVQINIDSIYTYFK